MVWIKRGLLYAPVTDGEWRISHAAVPVAERLAGDLYRVYFSARDAYNRSQTGWVEMQLSPGSGAVAASAVPILGPGPPGAFDDSGAMLCCIVTHGGIRYYYYIGWNVSLTVPFRNAIGLAISEDGGATVRKYSAGPILDRNPVDPYFVASCSVLVDGGVWRMWYVSCVAWEVRPEGPRHRYHIRYAESDDGVRWRRDGRVSIDFQSAEEYAISRPCVVKGSDGYHMWYSYRGDRYRIGYAKSPDGLRWQRRDMAEGLDVSGTGWDSEMVEYPFVFDHGGKRHMLYNGNGYGQTGFGLAVLDPQPDARPDMPGLRREARSGSDVGRP